MTTLKAEKRSMDVKAKKLRREGFVTGNLFGKEIEGSIPLKMDRFLSRVLYRDAAVRYATDRKVQNLVSSSVQMAIIRKCGAKQRCRGQM